MALHKKWSWAKISSVSKFWKGRDLYYSVDYAFCEIGAYLDANLYLIHVYRAQVSKDWAEANIYEIGIKSFLLPLLKPDKDKFRLLSRYDKHNRLIGGLVKYGDDYYNFNSPNDENTIMREHFTNTTRSIFKNKDNFGMVSAVILEV